MKTTAIMKKLKRGENNLQKTARQISQFLLNSLEGDFAWPVASFPLYSVTAEKLDKNMPWPLVRALDKVSHGKTIINFLIECVMEGHGIQSCSGSQTDVLPG